ncbi:hypothetical protein HanOQP8_Chr09g0342361 [Helianthus annuus]|nr:hypothetical protein HanLR1_Chr09g0338221 [Helianthus annuus]KAJ0713133.1 hypothetical protein HanOQP8_Chr09g0342361 [Helianthus annuus]
MTINHSSFYRLFKPIESSSFWCGRDAFHGSLIGKFKQCHNTTCAKGSDESQPFSLICCPCFSTDSVCESTSKRNRSTSYEILGSGVILLKNYISLKDQVFVFGKKSRKW